MANPNGIIIMNRIIYLESGPKRSSKTKFVRGEEK